MILVNIAKIDGEFAEIEREFIGKIARNAGLTEKEIYKCLNNPDSLEKLEYITGLSSDEKFEIIHSLVLLMNADGKLNKEEINYSLKVAKMLGYKESVLFEFITAVTKGQSFNADKTVIKPKIQEYLSE